VAFKSVEKGKLLVKVQTQKKQEAKQVTHKISKRKDALNATNRDTSLDLAKIQEI